MWLSGKADQLVVGMLSRTPHFDPTLKSFFRATSPASGRGSGWCFRTSTCFPHLTVLGNIIEAPVGVLRWDKQRAVESARALLERVGLTDKAASYPATLSGGQQQRVAIVRALIMDPAVMLFDEPTSALDPRLTDEVLTVIRDLAIRDRTSIIVTHEMGFARNVAGEIVVMAEGRIVEQGPPNQIFRAPRSRQLLQYSRREAVS